MKRSLFALLLLVICIAVGCKANVGTGSLTVNVSKESSSKTAMPEKDSIKVTSYKIVGTCGDSRFEKEFSGESCTITDLAAGTWSVSVEGYNNGVLVAKSSSQSIVIHAYQDVTAVFQLKPSFGGTGTFTFRLGIPKDATDMKQIKCSLIGASEGLGTYDFSFDFANGTIDGDYSIFEYTNQEISGGSYDLSVVTTNSLDEVFGIPINDSVVIYTDQTTSYEHIWDMEFFPEVTLTINDGTSVFAVGAIDMVFTTNDVNAKMVYSIDKGSVDRNDMEYTESFGCPGHVVAMAVIDGWSRNGYAEISNRGPAGGWIFYDCDADNDPNVNNGKGKDNLISSECKWRYLEAAPADLRLVNGVPTVDSTKEGYAGGTYSFIFGYYRKTTSSIDNICLSTATGIGEGYNNTETLFDQIKDAAHKYSAGTETTADYAARLCHELAYEANGEEFNDWFLPSMDELTLMYENLYKQGVGSFADHGGYWSSSEDSASSSWGRYFDSVYKTYRNDRNGGSRVRPVRAF